MHVVCRAEPILGSVTRFGRVPDTRQYSVLGRHKPADTEYKRTNFEQQFSHLSRHLWV